MVWRVRVSRHQEAWLPAGKQNAGKAGRSETLTNASSNSFPHIHTTEEETQIDQLAYQLHQLTSEEIAIVEKQK